MRALAPAGRLLLAAASLGALVFYAGSPMFYSYFQFGTLTTSGRLTPLLDHWPFRLWGRVLEAYQPGQFSPADGPGSLACRLQAGGKVEMAKPPDTAECRFRIGEGGGVYGPYLNLRRGAYAVTFDVGAAPGCAGGSLEAEVTAGSAKVVLAAARATIPETPRVTLSFTVGGAGHVLQQIETRVKTTTGCVVLDKVELKRTG